MRRIVECPLVFFESHACISRSLALFLSQEVTIMNHLVENKVGFKFCQHGTSLMNWYTFFVEMLTIIAVGGISHKRLAGQAGNNGPRAMATIKGGEGDGRTHLQEEGEHGPLLPNWSCFVGFGILRVEVKLQLVDNPFLHLCGIVEGHIIEPMQEMFHENHVHVFIAILDGSAERLDTEKKQKLVDGLKGRILDRMIRQKKRVGHRAAELEVGHGPHVGVVVGGSLVLLVLVGVIPRMVGRRGDQKIGKPPSRRRDAILSIQILERI